MRRLDALMLGLSVILFLGGVFRILVQLTMPAPVLAARSPDVLAVTANDQSARTETSIWPRPLFQRPGSSSASSPDVTGSVDTAKTPKLIGIINDGVQRLAVLVHDGAVQRVFENGKVGEWTVVRIDPHSAVLVDAGTTVRLRLDPAASRE